MKQETKEKAAKIWDDVKGGLEIGFNASKVGLKKAGVAIQNFSDKSVVTVEKKQFESKCKKAYAALGEIVAKKLSAKGAQPLAANDEEISGLLKTISQFKKEISKREKLLKAAEKEADNASTQAKAKK